jgi:class 3 adenylate cyclase
MGTRVHGFLFADLRGYTDFVERHGDRSAVDLLTTYRDLVRNAVADTGGAEIKTEGDSFYVVFSSASEAVRCGLAITAAAAIASRQNPGRPINVGIGIHAGETAETAEGYVGSAVNLAARLCAQAAAGEVLVSDTVRGLTRTSGGVRFTAKGRKRFKGIAEPMAVYAVTKTDLSGGIDPSHPTTVERLGSLGRRPEQAAVLRLAGVFAVAAIVVVGAAVVTGGLGHAATPTGSGPNGIASSSGPPSTSASALSSVGFAASASASDATIPESVGANGEIKPDTYVASDLPGTPSITVPDEGWSVSSSPADLIFSRTTSPRDRFTIRWVTKLVPDPCGEQAPIALGPNPEPQFDAWAAAAKGLRLSSGTERHFGDLATTEYDVNIVDKGACQYTTPVSVAVTDYQPGNRITVTALTLTAGERLRLEVSSRNGELILVLIEAPSSTEFNTLEPLAERILETLVFAP